MEHNPISMGDLAYGMASDEEYRRKALEQRVVSLEIHLEETRAFADYLVGILNSMLEELYGLDNLPAQIEEAIEKGLNDV